MTDTSRKALIAKLRLQRRWVIGSTAIIDLIEEAANMLEADAQQVAVPAKLEPLSGFDMRGVLASNLLCWHRLTEAEAQDLTCFFEKVRAQQVAAPAREPLSASVLHSVYCNDKSAGEWHRSKENYVAGFIAAERYHGITHMESN